jgi:hypothetical protein
MPADPVFPSLWTDATERAERLQARATAVTSFNDPGGTVLSGPPKEAVLRVARAAARDDLAEPDSAQFGGEVAKLLPTGYCVAVGTVHARNAFGGACRNWYIVVIGPGSAVVFDDMLDSDPAGTT